MSFACGRHVAFLFLFFSPDTYMLIQVSQSAESLAVLRRRLNSCYFTQHFSALQDKLHNEILS